MAGRALTSFTLLFLLSAGSSRAFAQNEGIAVGEPNPNGGERQAAAPPKLLGSGKGADGTHVFLFGRQGAPPVVFMGQPGDLKEVEVLGIERYPGKFVVDTFEHGEIHFNTPNRGSKEWSVTIPGEVGFNARHPTVTMRGKPDQAVVGEALSRMGYRRSTPLSSQTLPEFLGRVLGGARSSSLTSSGGRMDSVTAMKKSGAAKMKARRFRSSAKTRMRPMARTRMTAHH